MARLQASAANRIAFGYSATFAAAILVLGVVMYLVADTDFRRQQDDLLTQETANLAHEYAEGGVPDIAHAIAKRESGSKITAFGYALFDAAGRRIAGSLDTARPALGLGDIVFRDPAEGPDVARADARDLGNGYRLLVARDTEAAEGLDRTILLVFGTTFLLIIGMGVAGALVLGGYLRRRLAGIGEAARAIVAGDMAQRVPVGARGDEFDVAGAALNAMLDRIGQLMDNLRQVSSDVAHDLRTPLLRLRNQLEQVGRVDGAAERAIDLGDDVLRLFAAILRIAEVEGGRLAPGFAPVALSKLVGEIGDGFRPALVDGGRTLGCTVEPGVQVLGDRELLAQAVANLLDNASIHTPPGTSITLSLEVDGDLVRLCVADDGPGVSNEDRARILDRFYRAERSRTTPGNGLGLSLVAAVTAAHGGTVAIGAQAGGLYVTLMLPRLK